MGKQGEPQKPVNENYRKNYDNIWRAKCGYANCYQGKRKPTCGCESCAKKWSEENAESAPTKSS